MCTDRSRDIINYGRQAPVVSKPSNTSHSNRGGGGGAVRIILRWKIQCPRWSPLAPLHSIRDILCCCWWGSLVVVDGHSQPHNEYPVTMGCEASVNRNHTHRVLLWVNYYFYYFAFTFGQSNWSTSLNMMDLHAFVLHLHRYPWMRGNCKEGEWWSKYLPRKSKGLSWSDLGLIYRRGEFPFINWLPLQLLFLLANHTEWGGLIRMPPRTDYWINLMSN